MHSPNIGQLQVEHDLGELDAQETVELMEYWAGEDRAREVFLPILFAADDFIRALPVREVAWPPVPR